MKIQILGKGCPKCNLLEENVKKAVKETGLDIEIEKISDTDKIMELGVMITPALIIDGEVKSSGHVLPSEKITRLIRESESGK